MSIPYGESFSTTAHGCLPKRVRCEECGHVYYYMLQRSATGHGTNLLFIDEKGARRRSARDAEAKLHEALRNECDPVPCPKCGRYQPDMVRRARQLRHRWLAVAAAWTLIAAVAFAALGVVSFLLRGRLPQTHETLRELAVLFLILAGVCLACGLGLAALKLVLNSGYDPNAEDVKERKRLGKRLTLSREEYEEVISNLF